MFHYVILTPYSPLVCLPRTCECIGRMESHSFLSLTEYATNETPRPLSIGVWWVWSRLVGMRRKRERESKGKEGPTSPSGWARLRQLWHSGGPGSDKSRVGVVPRVVGGWMEWDDSGVIRRDEGDWGIEGKVERLKQEGMTKGVKQIRGGKYKNVRA